MGIVFRHVLLFFCVVGSLFLSSSAQTQSCSSYSFASNRVFNSCNNLPVLNAFLHWNYNPSSGTVDIAYRHTGVSTSTWIAWAINPTGTTMLGSQALVAFQHSNGSLLAYTSPVTSLGTVLAEGTLSFAVPNISLEVTNNEMIIYATVVLTRNSTTVNQLWQAGPLNGDTPVAHPTTGANIRSTGTLNFLSGQTTTSGGGANSRTKRRNVHGVLSALSWGILIPLGAVIARYLKVFKKADPAWFYIHVTCQCSAYIIGVVGWGLGLKLGSDSVGVQYDTHRNIGITLFCLGTLQVFALLLRPKKDHKYRLYWNIYHHSIGYIVIILSIVNVFKGFDILDPKKKWKKAYIGVLIWLGVHAVILEAYTWYIVLKRRKEEGSDKSHHRANGVNGVNGHGARPHERV